MTQQPPDPQAAYEARQRRALVKNLVGLILLVLACAGLAVVAWIKDPLIFAALGCIALGVLGYVWATSEAD